MEVDQINNSSHVDESRREIYVSNLMICGYNLLYLSIDVVMMWHCIRP